MTRPPMFVADYIRELTRTHTTTEHVRQPTLTPAGRWLTTGRLHTVQHPPLLDQVHDTTTTSPAPGAWGGTAYGSKPAGRVDALAFLERIERQSHDLAVDLGVTLDRKPPPAIPEARRDLWALKARLTLIGGHLGGQLSNPLIRSWWATARVLTQHDGPPVAPDIPCPIETCDRRGTLRIRIDEQVAVCIECHTVWTNDHPAAPELTFGRLALWGEWASTHLHGIRHWTDAADHGYPPGLGYRIECADCLPERHARAAREAARLAAARTYRQPA